MYAIVVAALLTAAPTRAERQKDALLHDIQTQILDASSNRAKLIGVLWPPKGVPHTAIALFSFSGQVRAMIFVNRGNGWEYNNDIYIEE